MKINEKLKQIRTQKNISTYALAELTGISQSTISKLENGKRRIDFDILEKIADALGVTLDYLTRKSAKAIIEDKLEELNMSVETLSERAKVPVQFINSLDDVIPFEGDYEHLKSIADALDMDSKILINALYRQEPPAYDGPVRSALEDFSPIKNPTDSFTPISINDFVNIPIVGSVRAGKPILAQDNIEGYNLMLKKYLSNDKDYFYLRVQGDSMNQEFNEGTLLLIEKTPWVENGTIAVVLIDGLEATVKKVIQNENMITLIPMSTNPEHVPHMYDIVKDQIQIVGRVKQATKVY